MKVLIISDVHANYTALQAVVEKESDYDKLIFLGDVVDYGPHPKKCIKFIKENADYYVLGNHDNALAFNVDCNCKATYKEYSIATRQWHKTLLDDDDKIFLRLMPSSAKANLDEKTFFLAHASPQGNISKYLNQNEIADEINSKISQIAEYIFVGHTHIQYKIKLENNKVINPGSIGLSREGSQACYAVYENGEILLKRIDYDVEKTIADLMKAPLHQNVVKGLIKILLHKVEND